MPFDIAGARAAGATDEDIKNFFRDRIDVDAALQAGSTLEEISEFLDKQPVPREAPVQREAPPEPVTPPPVAEPTFPAPEPPDLGITPPAASSLGVAEEPVIAQESLLQPPEPPDLAEPPVVEPTFEAPASTLGVQITPPEPIVPREPQIGEAPPEEVDFPELKALAVGATGVISQFLEAAGTAQRRVSPKQFAKEVSEFEGKQAKLDRDFDSLTIEEQRERLAETALEKAARGVRSWIPQEWREEVARQGIGADKSVGDNTRAITTATANTLPRIVTQWGLTAVPVVGPGAALGANMVLEGGSLLENADSMAERFKSDIITKKGSLSEEDERMVLQFQNRMEELSPAFGVLSGTVEFTGNAFGALAKEGKKKLLNKVLKEAGKRGKKSKVLREVLGFLGEGAEEVIQGGLQNVFVHKAIKDVRDKNKGKEFAPEITTGTTFEDFLGGVTAEEFITGAGVSALTRGLVKGTRRAGEALGRDAEPAITEEVTPPVEEAPVEEVALSVIPEAREQTLAEQLQLTPEQIERLSPEQRREFGIQETIEVTPPTPLTPEQEVETQRELDEELVEDNIADLSEPAQDKIEEISDKVAAPIVVGKESALKDVAVEDIASEIKAAEPNLTDTQANNIANVTSKHRISRLPSEPHINTELKKLNDEKQEDEIIVHTFLDLNKFKRINDTFGQAGGDAVMVATQQMMNDEAEKQGIRHFHKGGDEGVMVTKVKKEDLGKVVEGLKAVKQRIRDEAQIELPDGTGTIPVGMSMGVSLENLDAADELLKKKVPNSIVFSDEIKVQLGIEDVVDEDVSPVYDRAGLADARGGERRENGERRTETKGEEDVKAAEIEDRPEVDVGDTREEVQRPTPGVGRVEEREQPPTEGEREREEVVAAFRATRPQEGLSLLKEDSFTKVGDDRQAKKLKNQKGPDFAVVQTLENDGVVESVATASKEFGDFTIDVEFDTTPTGKPIGTGAFSIRPTKPNGGFKSQRETVFRFGENDKIFNAAEKTIEKHLARVKPEAPKKKASKPKIAKIAQQAAVVEAPLLETKEAQKVPVTEVREAAKDAGLFGEELKAAVRSKTKKREILSGYVNHFGRWMPVTAEMVNNIDELAKEQKKVAQDKLNRFKELGLKKTNELIEGKDVDKVHGDTGNPGSTGKDLFNNIKEELDRLKGISDRYRRQLSRRLGTEGVEGLTEKETSQLSIDDDVLENDNFRETVPIDLKETEKVKGEAPKRAVAREVVLDAVANKDLTGHDSKGKEVKGEVEKEKYGSSLVPPPIKPPAPPVAEKPEDDGERRRKSAASAKKKIEQNKKDVIKSVRKERTKLIDVLGKTLIANEFPIARRLAKTPVGQRALRLFRLSRGSNAATKQYVEQAKRNIIKGLTREEQSIMEDLLYANRIVEVDKIVKQRQEKVKLSKEELSKNPFALGLDDPDKVFMERKIANPRGLTAQEAQDFIDNFKSVEPEIFEKVNDRMNIWWDTMRLQIKNLKDEGLLSADFANFLTANHRHYSPRLFVQHIDPAGGRGFEDSGINTKPVNITDSGIRALGKGSEEAALITDPEYMLMNVISRTQSRVFKNRANKALLEYVKEFPNNDMGIKIEPKFKVDERGDIVEESPAVPDGFIRLKVWEKGKATGLLVPEEFASSWAANDPQASNIFMNTLKWMSGTPFLKAMATGINPEFAITNLPRDIAYTLLKQHRAYSPFVPMGLAQISRDMAQVSKDAAQIGPLTQLYLENGGGMEMLTTQGRVSQARVGPLKGTVRGKKIPGLAGVEEALDVVQNVMGAAGNFTERWTRIALMRRVLDKSLPGRGDVLKRLEKMPDGKKKQDILDRAVYTARTNIDFAQGGALTKSLDNLFPYLNASIQGTRGLFQAFGSEELVSGRKGEAIKSFGKASAVASQMMGIAFGMAYYAFVDSAADEGDDEETKKIKQEKRDRLASVSSREKAGNWIFHTPWKLLDKTGEVRFPYLRVSKDQGQRFFSAIGEAMATKVAFAQGYTSEDVDFDQLQMALEDAMVVIPGKSLPPVLDAWLAYSQNRDLWRKEDVWKGQMAIDPKFEKYHDTPKIFTAIGEKVNASPVRMEAALGKLVPHNLWTDMIVSIPKGLELLDPETKKQGDRDIFETISGQGGKARGIPGVRKVMRLTYPARLEKQKGKRDIAQRVLDAGVETGREVNGEFKEFSTKKVFKLVEEAEKNFNNIKQQNNMKLSGRMADHRQALDDLTTKLVEDEKGGLEDVRNHPAMKEIISFVGDPVKEAISIREKASKEGRSLSKKEVAKLNFLKKESQRLKDRFKTRQKLMVENKKLRLETGSGDLFRLIDIEVRARKKALEESNKILDESEE